MLKNKKMKTCHRHIRIRKYIWSLKYNILTLKNFIDLANIGIKHCFHSIYTSLSISIKRLATSEWFRYYAHINTQWCPTVQSKLWNFKENASKLDQFEITTFIWNEWWKSIRVFNIELMYVFMLPLYYRLNAFDNLGYCIWPDWDNLLVNFPFSKCLTHTHTKP